MNGRTHSLHVSRSIATAFASLLFLMIFVIVADAQNRSRVGEYEISGPYHHGSLTIFLIHGESTPHTIPFLTLEEAMERNLVKVYETGTVNELAIENLSPDHEVFIQAGEIVKGGRQDRTLGVDLTLAPNSGKVPIASFCVERGRWSKRGEENDREFSGSETMVTSNALRLAVRKSKNQSEVWSEVSVAQRKLLGNGGDDLARGSSVWIDGVAADTAVAQERLTADRIVMWQRADTGGPVVARGYVVQGDTIGARGNMIQGEPTVWDAVLNGEAVLRADRNQEVIQRVEGRITANTEMTSTTSLQLSLEDEKLNEEINAYIEALRGIIDGHDDVIGFAFTINGEMKNADIYASGELFGRLWPKLLRAAATEAVAEKGEEHVIGRVQVVEDCLVEAANAEPQEEDVNDRIRVVTRESSEHILFETQDAENRNGWVHRNYMKLE